MFLLRSVYCCGGPRFLFFPVLNCRLIKLLFLFFFFLYIYIKFVDIGDLGGCITIV